MSCLVAVGVHDWLVPPLQSQMATCVPSAVDLFGTSRHRFEPTPRRTVGPLTVQVKVVVAVALVVSVAVMVTVYVPAVVGVPEIRPEGLMVRPVGRPVAV